MDLATVWFALIVLCWVLFFVLEGFDFGVGMLAPILGRGNAQRGAAVRTIGPVWDGNEVWLVAAIGVMFAAFPDWYAALLSGLYLPFVLILLALAVRGVALEFRGKKDDGGWRRRCDVALASSSLVAAALFGAVFGAFSGGLPLGADGEVAATGGALARSLAALGSPAALLGALTGVLLAGLLGATYLSLRTTGPVRERARRVAPLCAAALLVPAGLAVISGSLPVAGAVAAVGALALVAVLARAGREALAFAGSALLAAAVTVAILVADYPVLLASSLDPAWSVTLTSAAASPMALRTISIAAIVVLPGVIAYQMFAYWVFRKRVASEPVAT
ncbi:MAG TPA: cytochrome d ubiquinol oxidase subunit II [Candidatus Ruania gallistercoris]|uniref:Cytochrome d ubiquinol oxidase subunit II n=1 Tax=Candidatus Ruania gallistercoris TaxID=2838746 RepID=A0A9D2J645_9MICO|nr:cytochrome d ubiquinol oxidase subunit II [Candidatus Ruania gallistercoris]